MPKSHGPSIALAVAFGALLARCGPTFSLRPPPLLPPVLPRAPAVPGSQATESEQPPQDGVHRAVAHPPGDLRAQTLAFVTEGDAQVRGVFVASLPRALVAARYTRVLLPDTIESLNGTLERTVAGDHTTLNGSLAHLLPMRATTPADQLVRVRVSEGSASGQRARRFAIPAAELQRYATEFATFQQRLTAARQVLTRADAAEYAAAYQQARRDYELRGGRYDDADERNRRDEADAFLIAHQNLAEQVQRAAAVPTPEQAQQSGTREETQTTARPAVTLDVVITDLRAGETWWVGDVVGMGDTREAALARAMHLLLSELGTGSGGP